MQTRLTTKELIAASFMELAAQKPIDKITVREVAANCGITTVTFYNHFRDKYDLIVWSYAQNTLKIMRKIGADGLACLKTLTEEARDDYATFDILKAYYLDEDEDMFWGNYGRKRADSKGDARRERSAQRGQNRRADGA